MPLTLTLLPDTLAVCRLDAAAAIPTWANQQSFFALTRTTDELSVICQQASVPGGVMCEPDWRALKVAGPLGFSMVGVLAGIAGSLAKARISLFAVSTFDTDYILVKSADLNGAIAALETTGYTIRRPAQS
jgi:hypothetical protein